MKGLSALEFFSRQYGKYRVIFPELPFHTLFGKFVTERWLAGEEGGLERSPGVCAEPVPVGHPPPQVLEQGDHGDQSDQ